MIILGVTGGLASGKSSVSKYLQDKYKAYIFDADVEAKKILHTKEVEKQILEAFPQLKSLETDLLSQAAFENKQSQLKLNSIIHPLVEREIEQRIVNEDGKHPFFIIDAAMMIESGSVNYFRYKGMILLVVIADKAIRKERALMRGNLLEDSILERMNLQLPDSTKVKHADFIVENNSTESELFQKIDVIITKITNE
jgi:dephospho-CoA kinase